MSTLTVFDRVQESSSTSGTGTLALLGALVGYTDFNSTVGNGNQTYYCCVDSGTGDWECGIGTYTTSGSTLSRTTVLSSSNANALVSFGTNVKSVFINIPAVILSGIGVGSGTVTTASVATANGLAGTVATATTTPVFTLSTTVSGMVKGNGTALSSATAGTDYVVPSGSITGTAASVTGTVLVANGGTGGTTFGAYSVLCAGTTGTGVFQAVAAGTNIGDVLTWTGGSSLPTYQTPAFVATGLFVANSTAQVVSTATETTLIPISFTGSATVPTALNVIGNSFQVVARGYIGTLGSAAGTLEIKMKCGSTILCTTGAFTLPLSLSNSYCDIEFDISRRHIGATVEHFVQGRFLCQNAGNVPFIAATVNTGLVADPLTNPLNLTATFSVSSASNQITVTNVTMSTIVG